MERVKTKCMIFSDVELMKMKVLNKMCPGFYGPKARLIKDKILNIMPCGICHLEI